MTEFNLDNPKTFAKNQTYVEQKIESLFDIKFEDLTDDEMIYFRLRVGDKMQIAVNEVIRELKSRRLKN